MSVYGASLGAHGDRSVPGPNPMTDFAGVPDRLLVPLLESAAATLRALPIDEVPLAARPLLGFDRRGLANRAARTQLRRALEREAHFRERASADFAAKDEVSAVLAGWDAADALALANASAARGDLPLFVSALVAADLPGAAFGVGVACAVDAAQERERVDESEQSALEGRIADLEEGLRRGERARSELEGERERLAEQLREERRARRERDERSTTETARLQRRLHQAESDGDRERARAERSETERGLVTDRLAALEDELEAARRVPQAQGPGPTTPPPATPSPALGEVARIARDLAAALDALAGCEPAPAAASDPEPPPASPQAPRMARRPRGPRRARPQLANGLVADTAAGTRAMLRGARVLLVVDGYNVSKTAWPDTPLAVQRETLARALHALHLRSGTEVVLVFDGDGSKSYGSLRRRGLRVMFSAPGQEADAAAVEVVAATPADVPVVVASSDRWVREHAERLGAVSVSAATLVEVLRASPARG